MKVLFSGYHNPHFMTITEYIENAIKALGHELIIFDDRQHILPGRIRYRAKWLHKLDLQHINRNMISLALATKPDVAIVTGGHRITPDSVKILRNNGICTVLWTIDPPINFKPILNAAPFYDHIVCQGTEAVEILTKAGIRSRWLPVACDPQIHRPVQLTSEERKAYERDVVFVGSFYSNRWAILKQLTGFDIGIWGPHWDKVQSEKPKNWSMTSCNLAHSEWLKTYRASKIVVIIHYQDGQIPCYQASPKVYEALACGCFVLVDRQRDVFALFEDKKHLVGFDNVEDLRDKAQYYLQHPQKCRIIATQGYEEVLRKHTYVHRIKRMLSILNGCS